MVNSSLRLLKVEDFVDLYRLTFAFYHDGIELFELKIVLHFRVSAGADNDLTGFCNRFETAREIQRILKMSEAEPYPLKRLRALALKKLVYAAAHAR